MQHSVALPNMNNVLPNLVNYRLGPLDSLNCDTTNSIYDFSIASDQVIIFPNPVSAFVTISTREINEEIESIGIYDQLGRQVISEKISTAEIDIRELSSGIFSVLIETNKGRYFKKLVVSE